MVEEEEIEWMEFFNKKWNVFFKGHNLPEDLRIIAECYFGEGYYAGQAAMLAIWSKSNHAGQTTMLATWLESADKRDKEWKKWEKNIAERDKESEKLKEKQQKQGS